MESTKVLLVFCTFPTLDEARQIATVLVDSQLVACVNLLPSVESVYRWEGKLETAVEVLGLMKTTAGRYAALERELKALHPYAVPEILAVPVECGAEDYLRWVATACAP